MAKTLDGKRIAILATDGVEQIELTKLMEVLRENGAEVRVISADSNSIRAWDYTDWGDQFDADTTVERVSSTEVDGLILPGGIMNADTLRIHHGALQLVRETIRSGKTVAAAGHATWLLIESHLMEGITLTGAPSIKSDVTNAGADWQNQDVVVSRGIITNRTPNDLTPFIDKIVEEIAEGIHERPGITDMVEEASKESFPASDAPGWQPSHPDRH